MRRAGGGGKVPEVAGRVRVLRGFADDCRQNPELSERAAVIGYKLIMLEGLVWGKMCFIRHSNEHNLLTVAVGRRVACVHDVFLVCMCVWRAASWSVL